VVAESGVRVRRSHATHLLDSVDWLLTRAGWSRSALDGFVATRGPGSFTGIRVGLGTVRGLGLAAGRPCVGVTTLDALAEAHGPAERERVALVDAGRGEVYGARFDAASSPPDPLEQPWLRPMDRLLESCPGEVLLIFAPGHVGEAARPANLPPRVRVARSPRALAAAAGRLALLRGLARHAGTTHLSPLYLRPPDATLKAPEDGSRR
jgi:tRNA threonylcarbamoyl adenosine modification protein YeaZ